MKKYNSQDVFIRQYQCAFEAGMTIYQLADFLKIKPDSLRRKKDKIKQYFGLSLPTLLRDNLNYRQKNFLYINLNMIYID